MSGEHGNGPDANVDAANAAGGGAAGGGAAGGGAPEAESGAPPFGQDALLDLMAYADGELEGEAAQRVEAWVASDAEAARWVEEFRTLSDCVAIAEGARPVPKSVDGIADLVMAKVPRTMPVSQANVPKAVRMRRAIAAGAVSAALAMAAGWWLFASPPEFLDEPGATASNSSAKSANSVGAAPKRESPANSGAAAAPAASNAASDPAMLAAAPELVTPGGVELEQVESPSREISVFYVPAISGEPASSIVVWIGDNKPGTPK